MGDEASVEQDCIATQLLARHAVRPVAISARPRRSRRLGPPAMQFDKTPVAGYGAQTASGSLASPRSVIVSLRTGWPAIRSRGKRLTSEPIAIRPSSRASGAPRQK